MKTLCRLTAAALMMFLMTAFAVAQAPAAEEPPAAPLTNLTEGLGSLASSSPNWAGYSELVLIPGSSFFPVKSTKTYIALAFTGGSMVDINNMVLYKTGRSAITNLGVKKVTYGGVSNPSINLASSSVCPVPPSPTTPCIIKLDPVKGALSTVNDYYFAVYFTSDSNNSSVASGRSSDQGALSGFFIQGDETRIKKKGALPTGNSGNSPDFVAYITNQ